MKRSLHSANRCRVRRVTVAMASLSLLFAYWPVQLGCDLAPLDGGIDTEREMTLTGSRDNTLYENPEGTLSNGSGQHVFAGMNGEGNARRALLFFDVAGSIPDGAEITAVRLRLSLSRTSDVAAQAVRLHRVLADWGEAASDAAGGEGSGTDAATDDATWRHTFFPTGLWVAVGGDFSTTASGETDVGDVGMYEWGSTDDMVADVQAWRDAPASNYGWVLIGDESGPGTAKRFDSREHADEPNRPTLLVSFTE